jgi:Nucleotidyltransferase domain
MTSGPAFLGELRDCLFDEVIGLLQADPAVEGVALVGSLGRGTADNWSDIDLLILMHDEAIPQLADEPGAHPWARADLRSDGRHNSPAGATSMGLTHIRSGLPLWVDLHLHPVTRTLWPTDSRPVFQRRPIDSGTQTFDQLNATGPRQPATLKTPAEIRRIHLSYVPIGGKYIARRSPRALDMIRFLGRQADFDDARPAAQLRTLRAIAGELSDAAMTWQNNAVTAYLDLVEADMTNGNPSSFMIGR